MGADEADKSRIDQAIERLERDNRELKEAVASLQKQVRQRELDTAYMYIHSNWLWIRWFLVRDQDRAGDDTSLLERARGAESTIRDPPAAKPEVGAVRAGTHAGGLPLENRDHRYPQPPRIHLLRLNSLPEPPLLRLRRPISSPTGTVERGIGWIRHLEGNEGGFETRPYVMQTS